MIDRLNEQVTFDIYRNRTIVDSSRRGRCAPRHPTHSPGRSVLESQLGADTKLGIQRQGHSYAPGQREQLRWVGCGWKLQLPSRRPDRGFRN